MFLRALGRKIPHQSLNKFRYSCRYPSQQWLGDSSNTSYARISVLQPGGSGDTSVDTMDTESHMEALTQHVAGGLAVPGASAAGNVNVFMGSSSAITAMSEEPV